MDCREAQDRILETFDGSGDRDPLLDAHIAGCAGCRAFAEMQRMLDVKLAAVLPAPVLSQDFQARLKNRIARETSRTLPYWLPDVVHLGSCTLATIACALLLPFSGTVTLAAGGVITAGSYLFTVYVRAFLDSLEQV